MKENIFFHFLVIALTLVAAIDVEVLTKYGKVRGSSDENTGNRAFLGIPYAAPPVGPLRFRPPKPPANWAPDIYSANKFGPSCNQIYEPDVVNIGEESEDCLYLNIWAPSIISENEALPVMVWFYGGSFQAGSSTEPTYNGKNLSQQGNIIVVTLNYRTGLFGFLASEILTNEDPNWQTSGNYGLLDQNLALKWVNENIKAFGGDPEKVTIFGESAGSFSVCYHLVMPLSKGLFKRAILQSGFCSYPNVPKAKRINNILKETDLLSAYERSNKAIKDSGCSNLTCLRNLSQKVISNYQNTNGPLTWPFVDGKVIPDDPYVLFKKGNYNKVEILLGTVLNEGTLFATTYFPYDYFKGMVKEFFPLHFEKVLTKYPESNYKSGNGAFSQLLTDFFFICPARSLLKFVELNDGLSYQYLFTSTPSFLNAEVKASLGAFHGSELFYNFNNPYPNYFNDKNLNFTQDETLLSNQMIDFWISFAKNGVPSSSKASVKWTKYNSTDQMYMRLNVKELKMEKSASQSVCDLYEQTIGAPVDPPTGNAGTFLYTGSLLFIVIAFIF